ncbi:substrate-binding domain-containing protein [Nonomuraea phyllanthi]|uniref:Substrate-binding domain-containing protein n=1 Tax=Nonomuraea phyllanthi TaxID=2219224 RepID=A0A5C4VFC0_9ACTN|nr:autoinducer 2 ABC transporter substrate-binding protein [Nonomuraea phyllanthi]KAB8188418.1 substrate-binding domain-containing protein [Nonomuraea phyllanthi]QFY09843.1 substrate-binding domain-containing protein [Nonomuraea phyllanthi]
MRNIRAGLVAALTAAALAACSTVGGGGPSAAPGGGATGGTKVAFVSQVEGVPYFSAFKHGAEQTASSLGMSYTQAGPATADATEQVRIFNGLVQQGYAAIAVSPLDPRSMNPAIAAARQKGIVVITSDADAPDSQRQLFAQQATDAALGSTVMDEIAKPMGGKGKYGIVSGAADTQTFNSWVAEARKRQESAYPEMQLVGGVRYTTDTAQALKEAQDLMTANPDLKGLIAVPSTAVPGVAQAVQIAGKVGKVAVSGFGSPKTARTFVESGAMTSTVLWDVPQLGILTVWAMKQLLDGKQIPAEATVPGLPQPVKYDAATKTLVLGPPQVFTKSNIAQFDY